MVRRLFLILAACLFSFVAVLNSGCANYRLGTGAELGFKSIFVAPIESDALVPQARALVGARLREILLRDPRVEIAASAEQADAILTVRIKHYGREATVSKELDAGLARKFSLTLEAECTLTAKGGKILFSGRKVDSRREAYVDGGQLQSEYEMLPHLADALARNISHATLDTW